MKREASRTVNGQRMRTATRLGAALVLLGVLVLSCSEPDKRVSRSTEDGAFELVLSSDKNWVQPSQSLLVQVTVRSLAGPLQEGLFEEVNFVVNNGTVSPRSLTVQLAGIADSLATGPQTEYMEWITFTASSGLSSERQGEINATFMDALATLKIRIVPTPASL